MVSFQGKLNIKIIYFLLLQTLLLKVNQREKTIGYSANMSDYNWGLKVPSLPPLKKTQYTYGDSVLEVHELARIGCKGP